jgi:hypothetical protein
MIRKWRKKRKINSLFNKKEGLWDLKNATELQNISYYLYCKKSNPEIDEILFTNNGWTRILFSQTNFVDSKLYDKYYKSANILIRKIKIENLKLC